MCGGSLSPIDLETAGDTVKGLTTAQMTGESALDESNLYFVYTEGEASPWLAWADSAENGAYDWFFPHLKGFNFAPDGKPISDASLIAPDDWPPKIRVEVKENLPSDLTYDGTEHKIGVDVAAVILHPPVIPEGASVTYYLKTSEGWGSASTDKPTAPGSYKATIKKGDGNTYDSFFQILDFDKDTLTIQYERKNDTGWGSVTELINAGTYRWVIKFASAGDKTIANTFTISRKPLTITAANKTLPYTGETQGEGDTVYNIPADIADRVKVSSLVDGDTLYSIQISGQGKEPGPYPITVKSAVINRTVNDKPVNVTGNYEIKYVDGTLTISEPASGEIKVTKELDGRAWTEDDAFAFTLTATGGAPTPDKATVTVTRDSTGGTESFGTIKFTKTGTYTYTVTETKGNDPTLTYDGSEETVTIIVAADETGNLVAAEGSSLAQTVTFTNTYTPPLYGDANLDGVLDTRDAILILQWYAFSSTYVGEGDPFSVLGISEQQLTNADVDFSKHIDAGDADYVAKYLNQTNPTLGTTGTSPARPSGGNPGGDGAEAGFSFVDADGSNKASVESGKGATLTVSVLMDSGDKRYSGLDAQFSCTNGIRITKYTSGEASDYANLTSNTDKNHAILYGLQTPILGSGKAVFTLTVDVPAATPDGTYTVGFNGDEFRLYEDGTKAIASTSFTPLTITVEKPARTVSVTPGAGMSLRATPHKKESGLA